MYWRCIGGGGLAPCTDERGLYRLFSSSDCRCFWIQDWRLLAHASTIDSWVIEMPLNVAVSGAL